MVRLPDWDDLQITVCGSASAEPFHSMRELEPLFLAALEKVHAGAAARDVELHPTLTVTVSVRGKSLAKDW